MFTKVIIILVLLQIHLLHLLHRHLQHLQTQILIILLILHNIPLKEPTHIIIINYQIKQMLFFKVDLKRKKAQLLK
jgi:hypothetical protein